MSGISTAVFQLFLEPRDRRPERCVPPDAVVVAIDVIERLGLCFLNRVEDLRIQFRLES